jgi:hypothetical protein
MHSLRLMRAAISAFEFTCLPEGKSNPDYIIRMLVTGDPTNPRYCAHHPALDDANKFAAQ